MVAVALSMSLARWSVALPVQSSRACSLKVVELKPMPPRTPRRLELIKYRSWPPEGQDHPCGWRAAVIASQIQRSAAATGRGARGR